MSSPEIFYLHIDGEQRGPYTAPQVDHLLNSGLIAEETLYWREGLEQWQPVTTLVVRREVPNRWRKPVIALAVGLVLLVLAQFFGPITLTGWRETNQHDFSPRAAYWRARDAVRTGALPPGMLVEFSELKKATVEMKAPNAANVLLRGQLIDSRGVPHPAVWQVVMKFDAATREWTSVSANEVAAQ